MRGRGLLLLLLLAPSAGLAALLGGESPAAPAQRTGRLEGRIHGLPPLPGGPAVRPQAIELYPSGARFKTATATVDSAGHFVLEAVPAGAIRLRPVFRVGDVAGITLIPSLELATHVADGRTTEVTVFGRGRSVTGKVELPDGIRPETVRVRLILMPPPFRTRRPGSDGGPHWQLYSWLTQDGVPEAAVDAQGRFRLEGVREGNYRFTATAQGSGKDLQLSLDPAGPPSAVRLEDARVTMRLPRTPDEERQPTELGTVRLWVSPRP